MMMETKSKLQEPSAAEVKSMPPKIARIYRDWERMCEVTPWPLPWPEYLHKVLSFSFLPAPPK